MSDLRALPTLDELAADPAKAEALPIDSVKRLLARHAVVGELLLARLIATPIAEPKLNGDRGKDSLIGVAQVADMLGRGKSWVEHHLDSLPPRRSLVGQPVWLRQDVERWIESLPKYGQMS